MVKSFIPPPNTLEKNFGIRTCLLAKPATYTCIYLDFSINVMISDSSKFPGQDVNVCKFAKLT